MSDIGTPDYVPPNELEKLKEAVPRAVNALADAMEEVARLKEENIQEQKHAARLFAKADAELARLKETIAELEEEERVLCPRCGKKGATYGPDPYASDINDDYTPVWECGDCRHESAMDV